MYRMNYIGKFISNFRDFYNEINAATLTGAIDVIVVQQEDGTFSCSPFHVRFGKLGVLRSREKVVDIEINGEPRQIHMKLGDSGEAFFVEEVRYDGSPIDSEIPPHLACSPIPHDSCFPPNRGFHVLSDLPQEQHEKILRDSVMSIEREKWEQMSALPPGEREKFLKEHFSDLPIDQREKWLQIASLTSEERDKIFQEYYGTISTIQKQQMIREQYSALKMEDKEKLFKENFPELPADQRQNFEKALLSDWKEQMQIVKPENLDDKAEEDADDDDDDDDEDDKDKNRYDEDIFDMEGLNNLEEKPKSFIAVTSSERIRKISVVKNDFRPITDSQFDHLKDKSSDESGHLTSSSSSSHKKNSRDEFTTEGGKTPNTKRKRKRKSIMKRKSTTRKTSSNSNSVEESIPVISQTKPSDSETSIDNIDNSQIDFDVDVSRNSSKNPPLDRISVHNASTDFHFFSDSEVTRNQDSRPSSPIQSDTEFEVQKITHDKNKIDDNGETQSQSWRWGELPSSNTNLNENQNSEIPGVNTEMADDRKSMLGGMFSFMKKTSRVRHNPESEGIYLSDINADELDPEVAALYFPSSHRNQTSTKVNDEEDAESGNGPSLPQSPNSVEGAIGGPKSLDSDFDESSKNYELSISLSLCGGLESTEQDLTDEIFQRHILQFDDIRRDPKTYENPNLVVKINGKYYNWEMACPIVMTYATFQRHLPQDAVSNLYDEKKRSRDTKSESRSSYSSWFSWRRSQPKETSPTSTKIDDNSIPVTIDMDGNNSDHPMRKEESEQTNEMKRNEIPTESQHEIDLELSKKSNTKISQAVITIEDTSKDLPDISKLALKEVDKEGYNAGGSDEDSDEEAKRTTLNSIPLNNNLPVSSTNSSYHEYTEKYRKTLRLSSEQISELNLKEGTNEVVFSVTTAYQGTTRCKCNIYKWRWDDKIVISDIDGTITKSDVLGHILPIVGKDWAQSGVAQLFTKIKNNGYKLLYLSARAIGQARVTREYLRSIKQDDLSLPDGPLLLNPTSLISALHREVIEKKPEEFKISCLSDIKALFPDGSQPFYAGYGNRINDVWAYRAVGIPITRIFTINHRGELKHELTQTFQSSYSNMSYIVDHLFPALREDAADEFSSFSYWREPIPELMDLTKNDTQS